MKEKIKIIKDNLNFSELPKYIQTYKTKRIYWRFRNGTWKCKAWEGRRISFN
jgi:hypothetical protein